MPVFKRRLVSALRAFWVRLGFRGLSGLGFRVRDFAETSLWIECPGPSVDSLSNPPEGFQAPSPVLEEAPPNIAPHSARRSS